MQYIERVDLTTSEAAARLGISDAYVRQLIAAGRITARRSGPRVLLIDETEIERFQRERRPRGWPKGRPRRADPPAPEGDDARR
jgi:excisionase family DNA binding protein